jgi:4-amino-4-deoxy-L-arabinose transferase-like glycosyltransferase
MIRTNVPEGTYAAFSDWVRNHALLACLIVLCCSISVRVFIAWRADPRQLVDLYPDAGTYLAPAESLVHAGAFLEWTGDPMVDRTPGYPTLLAALMLLVGRDLHLILIGQAAVLSLGVLLLYLLATLILPPVIAFTAGLLAAFSPWGAVLAALPLSDGLFLFLLVLIFLLMKLTEDARKLHIILLGGISVGLLTGAAVLVRPFWPLIIVIPAALLLLYGLKRKWAWLLVFVTLVSASSPVAFWKQRNQEEANFNGLSDIPGKTAWRHLAARVKAEAHGQNRHAAIALANEEERVWSLSLSREDADTERWTRAKAVFREYPFRTAYTFVRSAVEHAIHPSPDVLRPARLNFFGDHLVLALLWGALLMFAYLGWRTLSGCHWDDGETNKAWLLMILLICSFLTLVSGISFAQGSRLRVPLEAIVPLLAAIGLVRVARAFCKRSWSKANELFLGKTIDRQAHARTSANRGGLRDQT